MADEKETENESKKSNLEKALKLSNDEAIAKAIKDLLKRDENHFVN